MADMTSIWNSSNCLSKQQLFDYVNGTPAIEEIYIIESHIIQCPFCSDAIDGLMGMHQAISQDNINAIKAHTIRLLNADITTNTIEPQNQTQNIKSNIVQEQVITTTIESNTIPLEPALQPKPPKEQTPSKQIKVINDDIGSIGKITYTTPITVKRKANNAWKWSMAAGLLILIGVGGYTMYNFYEQKNKNIVAKEETKIPTTTEIITPQNETNTELPQTISNLPDTLPPTNDNEPESKLEETRTASSIPKDEIKTTEKKIIEPIKKSTEIVQAKSTKAIVKPSAVSNAVIQKEQFKVADEKTIASKDTKAKVEEEDVKSATPPQEISTVGMSKSENNNFSRSNTQNQLSYSSNDKTNESIEAKSQPSPTLVVESVTKAKKAKATKVTTYKSDGNVAEAAKPSNTIENNFDKTSDYDNGMYHFDRGEYAKSTKFLVKAAKNASNKDEASYKLAIAYIKTGKIQNAKSILERLSKGSKYETQAKQQLELIK